MFLDVFGCFWMFFLMFFGCFLDVFWMFPKRIKVDDCHFWRLGNRLAGLLEIACPCTRVVF